MRVALLAWELGAGAGHCATLLPAAEHLIRCGVQVHLALRDVCMAKAFFRDLPVVIHQAPFKLNAPKAPIEVPRSFAHILHNTGFADGDELESLVAAWLQLFKAVKPDLLVFDHSPSGLLASLLLDVPRLTLGSGFFTPPDVFPLPDLRPWLPPIPEELERDELAVHEVLSRVLDKHGGPSLPRVASLYRHAINYLTTFPELDNYGIRTEDTYIGVWSLPGGEEPQWPSTACISLQGSIHCTWA